MESEGVYIDLVRECLCLPPKAQVVVIEGGSGSAIGTSIFGNKCNGTDLYREKIAFFYNKNKK